MPRPLTTHAPRGSGVPNIAPDDLPRLMKLLYIIDREFLGDALWLRFEILERQAHQSYHIMQEYANLEAHPYPLGREIVPAVNSKPPPHVLNSFKESSSEVKDHLTRLPYDIRLTILEFLLKPLPLPPQPEIIEKDWDPWGEVEEITYVFSRPRPPHPLNQLAATSKVWRHEVEAFCGRQLLILKQQIVLGRQDDWVPWRELRMYTSCARMELVVRLGECCAFCGMETVSQSQKWPGLTSCGPCEDPWNLPEEARKRAQLKRRS